MSTIIAQQMHVPRNPGTWQALTLYRKNGEREHEARALFSMAETIVHARSSATIDVSVAFEHFLTVSLDLSLVSAPEGFLD